MLKMTYRQQHIPSATGWVVLAALAIALLGFGLVPELDLYLLSAVYDPASGFVFAKDRLVLLVHEGVPIVAKSLAAVLVIALGYCFIRKGVRQNTKRFIVYVSLAFVLGPLLIVNVGFKDHWGRARPQAVEHFGGTRVYSPPLVPSDQCERNCAFVSGHAAFGFFLAAPWLLAGNRRWRWLGLGMSFGICFGLARVLQGRHFPSDIIFAFFSVYLGALIALWLTDLLLPVSPASPRERQQC